MHSHDRRPNVTTNLQPLLKIKRLAGVRPEKVSQISMVRLPEDQHGPNFISGEIPADPFQPDHIRMASDYRMPQHTDFGHGSPKRRHPVCGGGLLEMQLLKCKANVQVDERLLHS